MACRAHKIPKERKPEYTKSHIFWKIAGEGVCVWHCRVETDFGRRACRQRTNRQTATPTRRQYLLLLEHSTVLVLPFQLIVITGDMQGQKETENMYQQNSERFPNTPQRHRHNNRVKRAAYKTQVSLVEFRGSEAVSTAPELSRYHHEK